MGSAVAPFVAPLVHAPPAVISAVLANEVIAPSYTPQGNQEEASLDEILDRPVDPVDHQNIINELQNMSNGPEPIEIDLPIS